MKASSSVLITSAALLAGIHCSSGKAPVRDTTLPSPAPTLASTGEGLLPVSGGHIWYKRSGTGTGTPMVLLHGGPGAGSFYLKPFEDLGNDRVVIRYDQLGAGKSDRLTDTTMMNIPHFVAELDSLRRAMKIDRWYLNSQSWGTVLALEYFHAHPEHVAGIVFGSPVFDWPAYARETAHWVTQMSDSSRRAIAAWKKGGSPDAPAFQAASDEFYHKYVFRHPVKVDGDSTQATFGNPTYNYMQGAYEFVVTGTLKDYDRTAWLPAINVPVLVTAGEFDEVGPHTVEKHAKMIPGAHFVLYKGSAHLTSWDARDANVKDVRAFLRSADTGK